MGQTSCREQMENPNPSLYSEGLWEEAQGYQYCTYSRASQCAVIIGLACGISAISSFLIIYIILKSPTKLSSIYHRIMFGMSMCQLTAMVPASFSTLPMPAPGDYWTDILNIQGTRLGNVHTCTAQGFLSWFGGVSAWTYFSVGLTVYYACAIGFGMTVETMHKYIEPLLHIIPIAVGLYSALPPLFEGGYNASYDWSCCTIAAKPWFCNDPNSTVACVRGGVGVGTGGGGGEQQHLHTYRNISLELDTTTCAITLVCFLTVCIRVYLKDREMDILLKDWSDEDGDGYYASSAIRRYTSRGIQLKRGVYRFSDEVEFSIDEIRQRVKDQYRDTKVITSQAMLYFLVYFIIFVNDNYYQFAHMNLYQQRAFGIIFALAQGFFQLLIFIFHQVFNQRRNNPNVSIYDAIIEIFRGESGNETFIMSRMHAVHTVHHEYIEDSHDGGGQLRLGTNESEALLSLSRASANFGSISPLSTNGRSLISLSGLMDGNSNIQQSTLENGNHNHTASSIVPSNRNDSVDLSRFSEQDTSIQGVSSSGNATFTQAEARMNDEYEHDYDSVQAELESESGPLLSACGVSANSGSVSANFGSVSSSAPSLFSTSWMMRVRRQNMDVIDDDSSSSSSVSSR